MNVALERFGIVNGSEMNACEETHCASQRRLSRVVVLFIIVNAVHVRIYKVTTGTLYRYHTLLGLIRPKNTILQVAYHFCTEHAPQIEALLTPTFLRKQIN